MVEKISHDVIATERRFPIDDGDIGWAQENGCAPADIVHDVGILQVAQATRAPAVATQERVRAPVLGSNVDVLGWQQALDKTLQWARARESRYVCHTNVHAVVTAARDPQFRRVLNEADMVTPDGMPLVWVMRRRGFGRQTRLSGPDFMWQFCADAAREGLKIFLYGSTRDTLRALVQALLRAFPGIQIVAAESPPFRALTPDEMQDVAQRINNSGAHAVFVSLGCPKQERWMSVQRGCVHAVMFGVGAAFDYHAGVIERAPLWMRARGLEWAHRLWSDPRRLWKRYVVTNSLFLIFLAWQFLRNPFARRAQAGES